MRRHLMLLVTLVVASGANGCAVHDFIFGALSDHYSAGGITNIEKRLHYEKKVQEWEDFQTYGSNDVGPPDPWNRR